MKESLQMYDDAATRKKVYAEEEAEVRAFMKMLAAGIRHPNGKPPRMGATMIREWLRDHYDEHSFAAHLLNLVEIHDDDAGWSINGVPQGEPWDLIEWIIGEMTDEEADRIEHALENYDCDFGALVIEAFDRKHGNKLQYSGLNPSKKTPPPMETIMQTESNQPVDPPNATPNGGGIRPIPPDLLARIAAANAPGINEDARHVAILLRKYPTGELPAWGITMAALFLREKHPVACNRNYQLLDAMQIDANDQTFSINGGVQGGVRTLISAVTNLVGVQLLEEEHEAVTWHGSTRVLVWEELERRAVLADR